MRDPVWIYNIKEDLSTTNKDENNHQQKMSESKPPNSAPAFILPESTVTALLERLANAMEQLPDVNMCF